MIRLVLATAFLATAAHAADPAKKAERPFAPGGKWRQGDMQRPRPRVITPPGFSTDQAAGHPPSDAKVLLNGTDMSAWKRDPRKDDAPGTPDTVQWKVTPDFVEVVPGSGSIRTRESFKGDIQLHIEWRTPSEVVGYEGQSRGNSGVFLGGFPEIQVLDSYQNDTNPDSQAASLENYYPPMVNACRKPGEWQTYDIIAERQRKDASGKVIKKARLSVIHNGIVVQWGREFDQERLAVGEGHCGDPAAQEGYLGLQAPHGENRSSVRYRNIWIRPINLSDPDAEGTPPPSAEKNHSRKSST